jgi:hypothetical protein
MVMQYYEVPLETIENVEGLRPWVELALEAAARSGNNKRKPAKRTKAAAGMSRKGSKSKPAAGKKKTNRGLRGGRG